MRGRNRPDWAITLVPTLPARADSGAFIYFVWCDDPVGHVKIGYAQNLVGRLSEMQTGCPFPLRVVAWFHADDPKQAEATLHYEFAAYGVRGEWFRIGPRLEQAIELARNTIRASIDYHLYNAPIEKAEPSVAVASPRSRRPRRKVEHFPIPARNNISWEWRGKVRSS